MQTFVIFVVLIHEKMKLQTFIKVQEIKKKKKFSNLKAYTSQKKT